MMSSSYCEYEKWYTLKGTDFDSYFVSEGYDLALTLKTNGLNSTKDRQGRNTRLPDQGDMVRFLTPLNTTLVTV